MANRLAQISGHISNTHSRGLLADEVVIVTGALMSILTLSHGLLTRLLVSRCRSGMLVVTHILSLYRNTTQGIGRSAALLFAKEGAKVVVSECVLALNSFHFKRSLYAFYSLDEKKAQVVADEITKSGGNAIAVGGDVGADDFPKRILDATIQCASRICLHDSIV
jgi:3-oxoacyl-[acyl-carrier protein] reductase